MAISCSGTSTTGYWKGWRCGAAATYRLDGVAWCANHYAPLARARIDSLEAELSEVTRICDDLADERIAENI